MKTFRRIAVVCMIILLVFAMTACNAQEDSALLRGQAEAMIDGLIARDADVCAALLSSHIPAEEFAAAFDPMCDLVKGCTSYELKQTSWNTHLQNGITQTRVEFLMTSDKGMFVITVAEVSDAPGLSTFVITPYDAIVEANTYTGTLMTMGGANPLQWGFLLVGLATIAFWIWAIVDCARHSIIKKSWWMVLIILGGFTWILTIAGGEINFRINYGFIFSHTALLLNAAGSMIVRFMIPVGAIIYAVRRKALFRQAEEAAQAAAQAQQTEPTPDMGISADTPAASDAETPAEQETVPEAAPDAPEEEA